MRKNRGIEEKTNTPNLPMSKPIFLVGKKKVLSYRSPMPQCLEMTLKTDALKPLFIPVSNYLSSLLPILLSGPSGDVALN